jgi:hypothetical protein
MIDFVVSYTPCNEVGGVYWIQRVRLSIRPSSVFSFPEFCWIKYADNELKLGMIVYNTELQIRLGFRRY